MPKVFRSDGPAVHSKDKLVLTGRSGAPATIALWALGRFVSLHRPLIPQPNDVTVRVCEFSAISPRVRPWTVHEHNAPVRECTMNGVDAVDLEIERRFDVRHRRLVQEDREVSFVADSRDTGLRNLELDVTIQPLGPARGSRHALHNDIQ